MKHWIGLLLVAALVPSVANAQAGARLCSRISSQSAAIECTRAVAGQRVDEPAAQLCGRISSNSQIVECARAVAGRSFSAEGAQLCGRISSNSEIVACARAVAGRRLDAGAVGVCGRISSNSQISACGAAIADKRYDSAELTMCGRISSNAGIVECLRSTGRRPTPAVAARPRRRGGDVPVNVVNDTDVVITRVYVRASGASRWPGAAWRGALQPGMQVSLQLAPGRWDVCVETADGYSSWWHPASISYGMSSLTISGSVRDTRIFAMRECVTR